MVVFLFAALLSSNSKLEEESSSTRDEDSYKQLLVTPEALHGNHLVALHGNASDYQHGLRHFEKYFQLQHQVQLLSDYLRDLFVTVKAREQERFTHLFSESEKANVLVKELLPMFLYTLLWNAILKSLGWIWRGWSGLMSRRQRRAMREKDKTHIAVPLIDIQSSVRYLQTSP